MQAQGAAGPIRFVFVVASAHQKDRSILRDVRQRGDLCRIQPRRLHIELPEQRCQSQSEQRAHQQYPKPISALFHRCRLLSSFLLCIINRALPFDKRFSDLKRELSETLPGLNREAQQLC